MGARVVGLVVAGIVLSGCGTVGRDASADGTTTIRSDALTLELPPGWHGHAEPPEPPQAATLRAATFPLTAKPADLGEQARATMAEDDILITVVDYGAVPGADDLAVSPRLPSTGRTSSRSRGSASPWS